MADEDSATNDYPLPEYTPAHVANFMWGNVPGEIATKDILHVYGKIIHWR